MKKYLFKISGIGNLEFSVPVFSGRKSEKFSKLLWALAVITFFTFIIVLPISPLFTGKSFETSAFITLITFMCLSLGLILGFLIIQGKKVLVDPKFFLSVLFFALLTTAAAVLKSPAHISNTFGMELLRGLSGITIMSLVGFFYFFNFLAKDIKMLNKLSSALRLGFTLLILVLIFHVNLSDITYVNTNLPIVLFIYAYLGLSLIFSKSKRILKAILLAVSAIFVFLTPQTVPDAIKSTEVITVLVLSLAILGVVYAIIKKEYVKAKVTQLRGANAEFKDKKYSLSEFSYFILLAVSVLAIVVGVLVHFRFNFNISILLNPINELLGDIQARLVNINVMQLFLGNGSYDAGRKISVLNSFYSSINNVFVTQGLVGLVAYIFILVTALLGMFRAIKLSLLQRSNRGLVFISSFTLVFVSIYSVIAYSGEILTILWWFAFATISVYLNLKNLKSIYTQTDWSVTKLFLKDKAGVYLRVFFSVLMIAISIAALASFTRIQI